MEKTKKRGRGKEGGGGGGGRLETSPPVPKKQN